MDLYSSTWIKSRKVPPHLLTLGGVKNCSRAHFHSRLSQSIFVTAEEPLGPEGTAFCQGMGGSGALKGSL